MDKKIIVNIGRQQGSGGREIGKMLALDLGAKFYDKELLDLAARESGFSAEFFARNDEKTGFFRSFLQMPFGNENSTSLYQNRFSQESLFKFQSDAIRKAANEGSCVFIGRCADYILRDFDDVVNVFITAPLEYRIQQVVKRHQVSPDEARKQIERIEGSRAEYYNYYTGKQWGFAASYDLCIDSSALGLEGTEKLLASFVKGKLK